MSPVTCHLSCVTCHVSHVTCHMSHVPFFFFGQSGEAYWSRVCYQHGLPRLVSELWLFIYFASSFRVKRPLIKQLNIVHIDINEENKDNVLLESTCQIPSSTLSGSVSPLKQSTPSLPTPPQGSTCAGVTSSPPWQGVGGGYLHNVFHWVFPHLLYLVLSIFTPPCSVLLFIRTGPLTFCFCTFPITCLFRESL